MVVADCTFGRRGQWPVAVARRVGKSVLTVRLAATLWGQRGGRTIEDAARPPGRKPLTARKIKQVVNLTLNEKPLDATHWSERTMSAQAGIAPSSVHKARSGPRTGPTRI